MFNQKIITSRLLKGKDKLKVIYKIKNKKLEPWKN
jgi:hypothetical protein